MGPERAYTVQKQKKRKRSTREDVTIERQLEEDALHIIQMRHNRHYSSLQEIDLLEFMRIPPADAY